MNKYKQGVNPILPLNEYIPDGEPHVFGDRIYLFGSHDKENGDRYCELENYVGWSAPLSSPTEWEYHGEIYSSKQDPDYDEKYTNDLYAPDVVKGNDGRYYLYYNFTTSRPDYSGHDAVHVAVCDAPVGKYEYYGFVKNSDGTVHNTYLMGDPAVLNDDGKIRLYAGWSLSMVAAGAHAQGKGFALEEKKMQKDAPQMSLPEAGDPEMNQKLAPLYQMLFKRSPEKTKDLEYSLMGANAFTLADDMLTVIDGPKRILPGQFDTAKDSSFFGHAFYEASSIEIWINNAEGLWIKKKDYQSYNGFSIGEIREYRPALLPPVVDGVNGIEIFADGNSILDAKISVNNEKLMITSDAFASAKDIQVRLGQRGFYEINIYNNAGIPMKPFSLRKEL